MFGDCFFLIFGVIKGRSSRSMICPPPPGFDPYCEGKWLPLQDEFTLSINLTKKFLQKLKTNFEKSKNLNFSKTAQPILMARIYVKEVTKEVQKKIRELIPLIKKGWKKLLTFFNNFFNVNYFLNIYYFFFYIMLIFKVTIYIFSKIIGEVLHS